MHSGTEQASHQRNPGAKKLGRQGSLWGVSAGDPGAGRGMWGGCQPAATVHPVHRSNSLSASLAPPCLVLDSLVWWFSASPPTQNKTPLNARELVGQAAALSPLFLQHWETPAWLPLHWHLCWPRLPPCCGVTSAFILQALRPLPGRGCCDCPFTVFPRTEAPRGGPGPGLPAPLHRAPQLPREGREAEGRAAFLCSLLRCPEEPQ